MTHPALPCPANHPTTCPVSLGSYLLAIARRGGHIKNTGYTITSPLTNGLPRCGLLRFIAVRCYCGARQAEQLCSFICTHLLEPFPAALLLADAESKVDEKHLSAECKALVVSFRDMRQPALLLSTTEHCSHGCCAAVRGLITSPIPGQKAPPQ